MAENKVRFLRGTAAEYANAVKDEDTFYYTTDDEKFYVGSKEITGSSITVDTALSDTSTNPVQNKVIKAAIDDKADKTTATKDTDGLMSASDKTKLDNADSTYALKSKYGDTTINVGRKDGTNVGSYSTAEGSSTTASGTYSHAEGHGATASGTRSHAEGFATTASGENSHAEGMWTISSGSNSCHAEGYCTTSNGGSSHAEGISHNKITDVIPNFSSDTTNNDIITVWKTKKFSLANGAASHVEGKNNLALGDASHAEGQATVTVGDNSHTSGYYTKALHNNEAAYGKYNESNDNTLFSIGDGTADDARHNAFEITTDGGKLHDKDIATTDLIPDLSPYAKTADVPNIKVNSAVNADTVNGKNVEMSIYTNPSSFGVSRSDTADAIFQAIPYGSIYVDMVQNLTDTSWNFPSDVNIEYTIYIAKISKHRIAGMYLYPKTGGNIYCGFVSQEGSFSGNWRKMSNDIKKVEVTASTNEKGLIALPENSSRTYISVVANNCLAILYNEPNSGGQKILVVDGTFAAKTNFSITFTAYYVEN